MGLAVLHSGQHSVIFKRLMGTSCELCGREAGENKHIWVCNLCHPFLQGVDAPYKIEHRKTSGEPFGIPGADETLMISWFQGGEVFRSGATWTRSNGKILQLRPNHETYPTYHQSEVMLILKKRRPLNPVKGRLSQLTLRPNPREAAPLPKRRKRSPSPALKKKEAKPLRTPRRDDVGGQRLWFLRTIAHLELATWAPNCGQLRLTLRVHWQSAVVLAF